MKKQLSFTKGYKKLLKEGGYLTRVDYAQNLVHFFDEHGALVRGVLKKDGTTLDCVNAIITNHQCNGDKVWNHQQFPEKKEQPVDLNSLEIPVISRLKADQVGILDAQLTSLCGIGYKKTLKKLKDIQDSESQGFIKAIARAYYLALKSGIMSTMAARTSGSEKRKIYKEKVGVTDELIDICIAQNFTFGYQFVKGMTNKVLFFELPHCEQVSICTGTKKEVPEYKGVWDNKRASVIPKVEKAIYLSGFIRTF